MVRDMKGERVSKSCFRPTINVLHSCQHITSSSTSSIISKEFIRNFKEAFIYDDNPVQVTYLSGPDSA